MGFIVSCAGSVVDRPIRDEKRAERRRDRPNVFARLPEEVDTSKWISIDYC